MKKILLLTVIAIFAFASGYSQTSLWTKTSEERLSVLEKVDRSSTPREYQLFQLNFVGLKSQLQSAPSRDNGTVSNVIIAFPNAEGKLENYRIYEASVMEPSLAASHPEIQSYVGQGIDDPTAKIHFTTTLFGLHTMTLSGRGAYYIDPYTTNLQNYIVYNKSSLTTSRNFECLVDEGTETPPPPSLLASDGKFRTYRLAMACTVEYAAFHIAAAVTAGTLSPTATTAQKKAAVLAAMVVTVARVNSVYEVDMSLRMQLVANNENLVFVDTDNFTDNDAGALINESQTVINTAIGNGNYDIGHTVSTGGGGLAGLGVVCLTNQKARGITGSNAPVGDPYDIDYVAHEMGHQFGASHTFNGTGGSCTGNRSAAQAVEPGSGSTIMAYAGICTNNVQSNSDPYFHAVSIAQMVAHITGTGNCVPGTNNGNTPPVIAALTNYTIPKGTAFILKGNGTDVNGDALTYCWEQTNAGATTADPSATTTDSNPNFRSLSPSTSPNRYMPPLANVLTGNLTPAWQVIPSVARTMNFALTVRDNRTPNGGQTSRQNMTVTFNGTAGPFAVTSQNIDGVSWTQGQTQTVTWNVAGTTANGINTANVNILLSTDGGQTFSTVLVSNTPNDGSQAITVPNVAAPFCRIMVEAVGNIYYAVNPTPFAIGYTVTNTCNTYTNTTPLAIPDGAGANVGGAVVTSTIAVPVTYNITDINVTMNVTHSYVQDLISAINHPDATQVFLVNRICASEDAFNITFSDGAGTIACTAPTITGTYDPAAPLSALNGKAANGTYSLLLRDMYNGDTGTLNSWSIQVCSQVATLSTENFGLADFKIYPNPNNGAFNVQFSSDSSNDIKIGVHDIRGRQIFDKSYQNTGLFSQSLELNNVQAGVYLVTVQDGDRKEVKKIVVE